jgi:hypothetical protein
MAQHNPQSRAYLIIVMAAIVVCFVIAQLILGGGDSESHKAADHGGTHATEASEPGHGEMSKEEMPPRNHAGTMEMGDDAAPPDEMPAETDLDRETENNP